MLGLEQRDHLGRSRVVGEYREAERHMASHRVGEQRAALTLGDLRVERRDRACRGVEVLGLCRCTEQRSHGLEIGARCREVQQGETCAPHEGRFGRGVAPAQRALEPSHRRLPLLHLLRRASFRLSLRIGYYHYRWYVHLSHLVGRGQVGEELVGEGQVRTEEAVVA